MEPKIFLQKQDKRQVLTIQGEIGVASKLSHAETVFSMIDDNLPLVVNIDSIGGDVFEGATIAQMIEEHPAHTHSHINGEASSVATIISLSADTRSMTPDSTFMIHFPSTIAAGNADHLREVIKLLDNVGQAAKDHYLENTDLSENEVQVLMENETQLSSTQTLGLGFVDEITESVEDIKMSKSKEVKMMEEEVVALPTETILVESESAPEKVDAEVVVVAPETETVIVTPETSVRTVYEEDEAKVIVENEDGDLEAKTVIEAGTNELSMARVNGVIDLFAKHPSQNVLMTKMLKEGASIEMAAKNLLDALSAETETKTMIKTEDNAAKGMEMAMSRNLGNKVDASAPNMGTMDIARSLVMSAGTNVTGMNSGQILMAAQKSTDFPLLLDNSVGKSLIAFYAEEADEYSSFVTTSEVNDFRTVNRAGLGDYALTEIAEAVDYPQMNLAERGASIALKKHAGFLHLTWEDMLADDLSAFTQSIARAGVAAREVERKAVYAALSAATNMAATAGAPSEAIIDEMFTAMTTQAEVVSPSHVVVPQMLALSTARLLQTSIRDGASNDQENILNGMFSIAASRQLHLVDPAAFYMLQKGAVELIKLRGETAPYVEMMGDVKGSINDTMQWKIRHSAAAVIVDQSMILKNAGA